jgi:hypothetical protein
MRVAILVFAMLFLPFLDKGSAPPAVCLNRSFCVIV